MSYESHNDSKRQYDCGDWAAVFGALLMLIVLTVHSCKSEEKPQSVEQTLAMYKHPRAVYADASVWGLTQGDVR